MDEVLIGFVGVVITVVVSAVSTAYWLGGKFRGIEDRLNELWRRLGGIEPELSGIKAELSDVEARLDRVEGKVSRLRRSILDFATTIRNSQEFVIEMLTYEGTLRPEAASVIRGGELGRLFESLVSRIGGNPLTKEELEEIRKYIQKEELTLEEAYRFKELAWKLVREYRYRFPDVWKIYWYAVAWIGWAARLEKERGVKGIGGQGK